MGDDDTADIKSDIIELCSQAEDVLVVCDAKVTSYLVFLNILGTDDHYDLSLILQLEKHLKLNVRLKPWQYAACMIVIE